MLGGNALIPPEQSQGFSGEYAARDGDVGERRRIGDFAARQHDLPQSRREFIDRGGIDHSPKSAPQNRAHAHRAGFPRGVDCRALKFRGGPFSDKLVYSHHLSVRRRIIVCFAEISPRGKNFAVAHEMTAPKGRSALAASAIAKRMKLSSSGRVGDLTDLAKAGAALKIIPPIPARMSSEIAPRRPTIGA